MRSSSVRSWLWARALAAVLKNKMARKNSRFFMGSPFGKKQSKAGAKAGEWIPAKRGADTTVLSRFLCQLWLDLRSGFYLRLVFFPKNCYVFQNPRASMPARALLFSVILFVWINFVSTQDGGMNAHSRFLTLHAISQQGSFAIDPYVNETLDWSRSSKDGHVYSNKAPGGVLLAALPYLLIDRAARITDQMRASPNPGTPDYFRKTATSFFLQVLPCVLLVYALMHFLLAAQVPVAGQVFFLLAFLFGNTAALFLNSYFGHGLAVLLLMAGLLFHFRKSHFRSALFLGFAVLTDYPAAFVIILFLGCLVWTKRDQWSARSMGWFLLGGLLPGALWVWYHTHFFGSPFALPISQEGPAFEVAQASHSGLFRIFAFFPDPLVLLRLLFGTERGLLWTQPWVLVAVPALLVVWKKTSIYAPYILASVLSFLGLLYLNACFPLWQGGGSPGPRYLSLSLPLLAFFLSLSWNYFSTPTKYLLWLGLGVALVFRVLVATGSILAPPDEGLWHYYWSGIVDLRRGSERLKLVAVLVPALLLLAFYAYAKFIESKSKSSA